MESSHVNPDAEDTTKDKDITAEDPAEDPISPVQDTNTGTEPDEA